MSTAFARKKVMANFVHNLRHLLHATGWSQVELARRLEIDKSTITYWLQEKRKPDGTARYAIADMLRRAKAGEFKEAVPA